MTRPNGFYWVRVGDGEPEVMRFEQESRGGDARAVWLQTGSDDYYVGDKHIEVLAGPLEPP